MPRQNTPVLMLPPHIEEQKGLEFVVQNKPQRPNIDFNGILERQRQAELEQLEYQRQIEAARQKAYHDAYVQDLRNRGYKIRYKKTFKDYIRIAITIVVIILIFIIAWHIPFIHNWLVSLYNDNEVIKFVVDGFSRIGK